MKKKILSVVMVAVLVLVPLGVLASQYESNVTVMPGGTDKTAAKKFSKGKFQIVYDVDSVFDDSLQKKALFAVTQNTLLSGPKIREVKEGSTNFHTRVNVELSINRYNEDKVINYLEKENIEHYLSTEVLDLIQFIKIKYVLIIGSFIVTILLYFIGINIIKNKLAKDSHLKFILKSLGTKNRTIFLFDNYYITPLYIMYFFLTYFLVFIFSILINVEFFSIYKISILIVYLVLILLYFLTYNIILLYNLKKLTK